MPPQGQPGQAFVNANPRGFHITDDRKREPIKRRSRAIGSRRAIARMGPPTELPELNCWSIEKHAGHLARWIGLFCFVLAVLAPPFKSKLRPEAENAVLVDCLEGSRTMIAGSLSSCIAGFRQS